MPTKSQRSARFVGGGSGGGDSKAAGWTKDFQQQGEVWVADKEKVWNKAKFIAYDETQGKYTVEKDGGKEESVKAAYPCNPSTDPVADMTAMQVRVPRAFRQLLTVSSCSTSTSRPSSTIWRSVRRSKRLRKSVLRCIPTCPTSSLPSTHS